MNLNVTQGSGTVIATVVKEVSANYQRVVTHRTRNRVVVVPTLGYASYASGQYVGPEVDFNAAFRAANEPNLTNTAEIDTVQVRLAQGAPFDMDLFFLAQELDTPPVDGGTPAMAGTENLGTVQFVVQVRSADWLPGLAGDYIAVKACPSRLVFSGPSETQLRMAVVARANGTITGANPLSFAVNVTQD
jgi:hypothetical protein